MDVVTHEVFNPVKYEKQHKTSQNVNDSQKTVDKSL